MTSSDPKPLPVPAYAGGTEAIIPIDDILPPPVAPA